nr:immunoglobulin light chain junction region [Macaca mulatta]
CMQGLEFAWTF